MQLTLRLDFGKGYLAHSYWPELEKVINIEKESGFRRVRSEAARQKTLAEYLTKVGMTKDELEALRARAERQFYTADDIARTSLGQYPVNGHDPDEICIPPNQIYGCLAQASDLARSATRVASRDQIRSVLDVVTPIYTGKVKPDGIFERFAVVTSGTGAKLSNQRALRRNAYVGKFSGELVLEFDRTVAEPQKVEDFLAFAGREIGIGASRKLGWGRFAVTAVDASAERPPPPRTARAKR
jgi:hypothetical protein